MKSKQNKSKIKSFDFFCINNINLPYLTTQSDSLMDLSQSQQLFFCRLDVWYWQFLMSQPAQK